MSEFKIRCVLLSGDGEDYPGCKLELAFWKWTKYVNLPPIIKPARKKVVPKWDETTIARLGRDFYWDYTERAYGSYLFGNHFNILYGLRSDDSRTEQRWSCFLPFASWRFHRHSLFNLDGRVVWSQIERSRAAGINGYEELRKRVEALPKAVFAIADFDGDQITASTYIEEREWRFGAGWFKWLSLFVPRKVRRSLDINFNKETGPRKGSWKGGTVGHSIEILDGDSPEWAFRRYCAAHQMTFLRRVEPVRERAAA